MKQFKLSELNKFMGKLLKGEEFDGFLIKEGMVRTYMDFTFSGDIYKDYYDTTEQETLKLERYSPWSNVKPLVFDIVKGTHKPLYMKLVLVAGKTLMEKSDFPKGEVGNSYSLTFTYKEGIATIVTGLFKTGFSLDKEIDREWDEYVKSFLENYSIGAEEIV